MVLLDQLAEKGKINCATWHRIDSKLQRTTFYRDMGGELLHDIDCELIDLFTTSNSNSNAAY